MNIRPNENELITEVDEKNIILGLRPRIDFEKGRRIHRSSYLLILDLKGRMLLQKRSLKKKWHPGKYTFPVAGTVANETYKACMHREVKEAFNKSLKFKKLFDYKHFDKVDKAFKRVFMTEIDCNDIDLNSDYANSYRWITRKKLEAELEMNPQKYAPPFVTGMQIFP